MNEGNIIKDYGWRVISRLNGSNSDMKLAAAGFTSQLNCLLFFINTGLKSQARDLLKL